MGGIRTLIEASGDQTLRLCFRCAWSRLPVVVAAETAHGAGGDGAIKNGCSMLRRGKRIVLQMFETLEHS
jgi:hypothetical protein